MIRVLRMYVGAALMLVISNAAPAADLIVNGGFESPVAVGNFGNFQNFPTGSTGITGWVVTAGSTDLVTSAWFLPYSGNQSLDLDGSTAGTIQQVFATAPAQTYTLSFRYANNPQAPSTIPASAVVEVIGSGATPLLSASLVHGNSTTTSMNYSLYSAVFVSDSTSTTLRFRSTDPAGSVGGIVLDEVSVVPEPGSLAILGVSGALLLIRRRP